MRTVLYSLAAVACVSLAPVAAVSQSDGNANAEAKANSDNEVVCRYVEADSGTRLSRRRVCRSRAEWTSNREATQRSLQQRGSGN
jgi:hypothetical protein